MFRELSWKVHVLCLILSISYRKVYNNGGTTFGFFAGGAFASMNQGGGEIALKQEAEDVGEKFKRYAYNFTNVQLRSKTVIHCTKHYNPCNAL